MFDDALLKGANFRGAEVLSIFVYDEFSTRTTSVLVGREARQWLYSKGAKVFPVDDLNPLLGKPWYQAAREVTRTLEQRIAGVHQDTSLSKGTSLPLRKFTREFVEYLVRKNILMRIGRSKTGPGWQVKVNSDYRTVIHDFSENGKIAPELEQFFRKHLPKDSKFDLRKL